MAKLKYEKYIIRNLILPESQKKEDKASKYSEWSTRVSFLEENVTGEYHAGCSWYLKVPAEQLATHKHDYSKLLGFYGSDPENPFDLGGEIEFVLEDEKYTITQSCLIYVPKGINHSMTIKRVDRPIFSLGFRSIKQ